MSHRKLLTSLSILLISFTSASASARIALPVPEMQRPPPFEEDELRELRPVVQAQPRVISTDLSPAQQQPFDSMQLVVFYDGDATARPMLRLHCVAPRASAEGHWVQVRDVPRSSQTGAGRISTFELAMNGCVPTGRVIVDGMVPDGVIDGVAFGMMYRDANGRYHTLRSQGAGQLAIVGIWPLVMSTAAFASQTPQLTAGVRSQAMTLLLGAQYLGNGLHSMRLPSSFGFPANPAHIESCPHCRR